LNETRSCSCLFVSVDEMMRLIRGSINDKSSIYTESYFVDLLSKVDYLGLDDLGAESGSSETDKSASDFTQRVLNAVTTARQDKSTITTTNLSGQKMRQMYDGRIVSRLLKNPRFIVFKETKDKRISGIPF
jgi:DNA replication protein DnaC